MPDESGEDDFDFEPSPKLQNVPKTNPLDSLFMDDPQFAEAMSFLNSYTASSKPKPKKKRARSPTFRSFAQIPLEKRSSDRLRNKKPLYSVDDLEGIEEYPSKRFRRDSDDDISYLEEVVFRPRKSRISSKSVGRPPILAVEDVTDDMLANIPTNVKDKVYSQDGSSCHQCRQKTKDTKTCCRNPNCIGIRGQLCGVCIFNRYGENIKEALLDPNWQCFVCRGICNCSFCRKKEGKRPTGILAPVAQQNGYASVKHFLESLNGKGDYVDQDDIWEAQGNPDNLLGFKDERVALMGGKVEEDILMAPLNKIDFKSILAHFNV